MTETLQGGLIAIGTLAVTKGFELLFNERVFLQSKKKEYFIRKLNAFEKTAAYYNIAQASIGNMSALLKVMHKENVYFTGEDATKIIGTIKENLDSVYKLTQDTAMAIGLYVDEDFEEKDGSYPVKYFEKIGEMNLIGLDLQIYEQLKEGADTARIEQIDEKIEGLLDDLRNKVNELKEISDIIKPRYKSIITSLRNKLKKYD